MRRPPASSEARAAAPLAAALGLAAAGTLAFTLYTVCRLHVPLPYRDEWYTVFHFRRAAEGDYGLADLASQHNEHRLLFPRLVFFADERFFALSGWLDAAVTVLLQAINAAVLIRLACRLVARPAHRALLAAFAVVLLFTLSQEQNFTNGFQLQFVGVFTAALLASVAYASALERRARGEPGAAFFALAALGCAVSTYTMANGVLVAFVLAGVAALRRAPTWVVAGTLAFAGLLAALFFHAYVPGGDSRPLPEALARPLPYLRYVSAYFGSVFGLDHLRAAQALGTAGLLGGLGALWRVGRGTARDGASVALASFAAFMMASAAATAYGRIKLGTVQAFDSRYVTPSLLFWTAVVFFWFPVAVGPGRPRAPALALGAAISILAALSVAGEAAAWPALAARSAALRRASDSLMAGLYDAEAAGVYEIMPPDEVAPLVPFLRDHRLAAFADPVYAALGRPLAGASDAENPAACDGTAAASADPELGPGGVRLSGRAVDLRAGRAPRRILVTDAAGTVVGFGSASLPGEPSRLWSGYARANVGQVLTAYALLGDGVPCRLGAAAVAAAGTSAGY